MTWQPQIKIGNGICPKCSHPLVNAAHGFDVMGKTTCPMCPNGICVEPTDAIEQQTTVAGMGMDILSAMTPNQLIDEIMLAQRVYLKTLERHVLIHMVVHLRLSAVRERLHKEAGIEEDRSIFGW